MKIYIYRNGSFTNAYHQLDIKQNSDMDRWIRNEAATGVNSMWVSGRSFENINKEKMR